MIWAIFVRGGERLQIAAVQMLGQIDGPSASNGLAVLAVFSPAAEVRRRAIETLTRRDPRDVVGRLIGLVHKPYKYQVRHVNGPGSPGELFVEGERFNIQRFYQNQTAAPALGRGRIYTPDVPFDPFSVRNLILATIPELHDKPDRRPEPQPPSVVVSLPGVASECRSRSASDSGQSRSNAAAILSQLINNPANRYAPPGYWFFPPNQVNGVSPQQPVMLQPGIQQGPAGNADPLSPHVVPFNTTALSQFRVTQQDINNALHQAATVKRLER